MRGLAVGDMGASGGCARLLIEGVFCVRSGVIASVFVKLLHFVFGGEAVRIGQLQIDFVDGVVVVPAADLLNLQFAHAHMKPQRSEGTAETVGTARGQSSVSANTVDGAG